MDPSRFPLAAHSALCQMFMASPQGSGPAWIFITTTHSLSLNFWLHVMKIPHYSEIFLLLWRDTGQGIVCSFRLAKMFSNWLSTRWKRNWSFIWNSRWTSMWMPEPCHSLLASLGASYVVIYPMLRWIVKVWKTYCNYCLKRSYLKKKYSRSVRLHSVIPLILLLVK